MTVATQAIGKFVQISENSIYIIGGGPAGLTAAISAFDYAVEICQSRNLAMPNIFVLEKKDKIGQSILRTGNGRCNFSNANIGGADAFSAFNNADFVEEVNAAGCKRDSETNENPHNPVAQFFDKLGLGCQIKQSGMMFPYTNKASSVVDVLRFAIGDRSIKVCTKVEEGEILELVHSAKNDSTKKTKFIFATGGEFTFLKKALCLRSTKNTETNEANKIKILTSTKVLGPIKTDNKIIKKLDGTRANVELTVMQQNKKVFCETGEILFRKYGVSGIVAFNASRFLSDSACNLAIDYFPNVTKENLEKEIANRAKNIFKTSTISNKKNNISSNTQKTTITRAMAGLLLPNIAEVVLQNAKIEDELLDEEDKLRCQCEKAAEAFKKFSLQNAKVADPKQCQVSRGGFATETVDSKTMRLKSCSIIFVAGECVDIDGPCGGYNLHWAWLSGIVAGRAAAQSLL